MTPQISVVVPCYNVEKYIDRCMESLINQTIGIENLELILVNDASTDRTLDKLKAWEEKIPDSIMVITYEENIKQGGARNIGMQYARADYIGFVDADDWIELDMYETLYGVAQSGEYDVVRGKFVSDKCDGTTVTPKDRGEDKEYHFEKRNGYYVYKVEDEGKIGKFGGIVTGIYRKSIIIENNVWFPERITYEDNFWGEVLKLYTKDLCIVDKVVYHYFRNPCSTVTTLNSLHHLDRLVIEVAILEEFIQRGIFEDFYEELEWGFIQRFYINTMHMLFTKYNTIPDVYGLMKRRVFQFFPNYKQNPKYKECNEIELALLSLLDIPGELTVDELEKIRVEYIKGGIY